MTDKSLAFALILTLGCATSTTQTSAATQTTTTAPTTTPAAQPQSQFKNLQVFPRDIPRDQLIAAMRGFTRGLGVRCNFCHVATATEPKEELDFASDAKEEKRVARVMIQMAAQINGTWIPRAQAAEGEAPHTEETTRVACWTCHRGKPEPELPPPPPAPAQQAPAQ
ncbi:MAG TPA: c-type cytochrome [Thermoanaerobaculia bacterium]|nr:c-type cytochrome [Thermoanaerobaculia bacterium]